MRKSIKSPLATVCRAECIQIFTGQRVGNTSRKKTFLNDINPVHKEKHQHIIPTSSKTLFIEDRVCESTFRESMHHVSMCRCSRMTRHDQAVSQQTNVRTGRSAAFQWYFVTSHLKWYKVSFHDSLQSWTDWTIKGETLVPAQAVVRPLQSVITFNNKPVTQIWWWRQHYPPWQPLPHCTLHCIRGDTFKGFNQWMLSSSSCNVMHSIPSYTKLYIDIIYHLKGHVWYHMI